MANKKILPLLAFFLLSGCGKEKEKTKSALPDVPESLTFTKPAPGQKLTKGQLQNAKKIMSSDSKLILPPGELIFRSQSLSPQELQEKELQLKQLDANSYALLKDIHGNCDLGRPTSKINASFPTSGDFSLENLKVNDYLDFRTEASIGDRGSNSQCPIKFQADVASNATVNDVNSATKSLNTSGSMSTKGNAFMIAPKYQALLNARGIVVDGSISGLVVQQDTNKKALSNYKLSGTYYTLSLDIPYSADVQLLMKGFASSGINSASEVIISMNLSIPNNPIKIDVHIKYSSSKPSDNLEEYYVNGNLTSKEEFNALFGQENPAINSTKTMLSLSRL